MMCNYLQTSDKKSIVDFVKEVPKDCIIEVTVHGIKDRKLKAPRLYIYIDDVIAYDLDFVNKKYINFKRDIEFYMTDTEAFMLNMYLCTGLFEIIEPHWWPYAERNIARHGNPLKEFKDAQSNGSKIVLSGLED